MKIDILIPDLRGGGAERVSLDLAREFSRSGHSVRFLLMRAEGDFLYEASTEFAIKDLKTPKMREVPRRLIGHLRGDPPDALLASMWPLTAIAPVAVRLTGHRCRIVVAEHGILSDQYQKWGKKHRVALRISTALGYRLADGRVGVSESVAADMARLSGLRIDRFQAIHNPVPQPTDPSPDENEAAESMWSVPRGSRILTVGRMKEVKNHPLLISALSHLGRPNAQLMIVGDGNQQEDLQADARALGMSEKVIFAGFQNDPTPFYRTADLFVLSSNREGFGNVIVEALVNGTPVVSTDCGSGPREILDNGCFGRLTPVGDAAALAQAMEASLNSAHDTAMLKRRGNEFSPHLAAQRYLSLMT